VDRGTVRLLIVVALAVVGGLVLANGFDGDAATGVAGATPTSSVTPTDTPTDTTSPTAPPPDRPEPQPPEDVTFMALNATNVTGAGATAQDEMEAEGYVAAEEAADSPVQGAATSSILYRGGEDEAQNRANAKRIANKIFPGSQVAELSQQYEDAVPPSATIVVVVGQDWADQI